MTVFKLLRAGFKPGEIQVSEDLRTVVVIIIIDVET